mmetsp:Transcript_10883/g.25068  ORF Transcript_10883/g.25068 Transcript_10883/m.25068 type:complete len:93 (+) Transcript_10883:504-782(+)
MYLYSANRTEQLQLLHERRPTRLTLRLMAVCSCIMNHGVLVFLLGRSLCSCSSLGEVLLVLHLLCLSHPARLAIIGSLPLLLPSSVKPVKVI